MLGDLVDEPFNAWIHASVSTRGVHPDQGRHCFLAFAVQKTIKSVPTTASAACGSHDSRLRRLSPSGIRYAGDGTLPPRKIMVILIIFAEYLINVSYIFAIFLGTIEEPREDNAKNLCGLPSSG